MGCLSVEPLTEKYIREHLVVSLTTSARVDKLIDAVVLRTERAIHCSTLYMDSRSDMIAITSLNISPWIS